MKRRLGTILVAGALIGGLAACGQGTGTPGGSNPATEAATSTETATPTDAAATDPAPTEGENATGEAPSGDTETFVKNFAALIAKHWPHMGKVWPGMDYTKHDVVLFKVNEMGEAAGAWLVNSQGSRELEASEYQDMWVPSALSYDQVKFGGRDSIAISFDEQVVQGGPSELEEFYRMTSHELVHFYYQDAAASAEGQRAQPYPLDANARLYRELIYRHLVKALEEPASRDDSLGRAAYWRDKWKTEFSQEAEDIRSTDNDEGIARYTENGAMFIGDGTPLRDGMIANIKKDPEFNSASAESYEIGFVAAALLDELQPGWKDGFYAQRVSVVDKVLDGVAPVSEDADPAVVQKVTGYVEEINAAGKAALADVEKANGDTSIPYLRIDETNAEGSFSTEDVFLYDGVEVMTQYARTYPVTGGEVRLNGVSAIAEFDGERVFVTVPLTGEYKLDGDKLTVDSDGVKVSATVNTSQEGGRTIYTAVATG